jgi:hypothetical protein
LVDSARKKVKGSMKLQEIEDMMTKDTTLLRSEAQVLSALESQFTADVIVIVYSSLEIEDKVSQAMLEQYSKLA